MKRAVEKTVAKLTIARAADMTPKGRRVLAAWLRRHAQDLVKEGHRYSKRFTGRYMTLATLLAVIVTAPAFAAELLHVTPVATVQYGVDGKGPHAESLADRGQRLTVARPASEQLPDQWYVSGPQFRLTVRVAASEALLFDPATEVRPEGALADTPNRVSRDPKIRRDRAVTLAANQSSTDRENRLFGEPRAAVAFAPRPVLRSFLSSIGVHDRTATLLEHVPHVVGMATEEEVGGIAAGRVVASMKNPQFARVTMDERPVRVARGRSEVRASADPAQSTVSTGAVGPAPPPRFTWTPYSFTETAFTVGGNKTQVFGARFQAHVRLPYRLHVTARLDATKTQDGGAVDVNAADPKTFTSAESYFAAEREIVGPLTAMVVYGITLPVLDGRLQILERYPKTFGAGVGLHVGSSWLAVVLAKHDPAGSGAHALFAGSVHLHERTYLVADGALGRGSYVRGGVALRLKDE